MIARLIHWSFHNRLLVLLGALALTVAGVWSLRTLPLDALPDLSDVQVIVRATWPGQGPQRVEDQVTYPLTTLLMSVPGVKTVRGYSLFGDSFVYVLFADDTDVYWARSRVVEYLSQARLPPGAQASLGPDATGVGWIYEYALVDRRGGHDLADLRALQDWFLRFELKSVPDIAEVAAVGGMVKQYQIVLDPHRLTAYGISHTRVVEAIRSANQETGGGVVELAEAEYMVRTTGYLRTLDDFRSIPLTTTSGGVSVTLGDVARVQLGPELRRGIAELNGQGEVAGGVVILRAGANAYAALTALKSKLAQLQKSLPPGVEIVTVYDRSALIERAVTHIAGKLVEEFLVVAIVCALFLWHVRSALVAIVALPLGILAAFILMRQQGINADLLSLGGIAIAIGAMVDAAVVMIENAHKHLETWRHAHPGEPLAEAQRVALLRAAAVEVGPALFFSLLIVMLSFLPILTLQAHEGRLFAPLAYTKTYAMAAAAGLSVTLVPVLLVYWVRGRLPDEHANPLNRGLLALYRPLLDLALRYPKVTLTAAALLVASTLWPWTKLGSEFMPPLDEGDLLYMPTALPGLSAAKAQELLQQTDRLIKTVPEVASVFGKAGRAETATDPAPLEMFETTIRLKPRDQWRPGLTPEKLLEELDRTVRVPGLANLWVPPIRNRIDMLATGIKSPIGVKVFGPDLLTVERAALAVETVAKGVPGVTSAVAERLSGGRYLTVDIDRAASARYGLSMADVQAVVSTLIGGENIGTVVDGRARFPINVRYPRAARDTLEALRQLPMLTPAGASITLQNVARLRIEDGPPMIKSENARLSAWVYINTPDSDLGAVVAALRAAVAQQMALAPGVSLAYAGRFEFLERAQARLWLIVPATLLIVFTLLYLTFRRLDETVLILLTLPCALSGGVWLLYALGYHFSVAVAVGLIALAGVAAEFGIVMLIYLRQALAARVAAGQRLDHAMVLAAMQEGGARRVRPKAMTVTVILAGLLPLMWGEGSGAEIMSRIAAPLIGGMISAPLLSLFVVPAAYLLLRTPRHSKPKREPEPAPEEIKS